MLDMMLFAAGLGVLAGLLGGAVLGAVCMIRGERTMDSDTADLLAFRELRSHPGWSARKMPDGRFEVSVDGVTFHTAATLPLAVAAAVNPEGEGDGASK